MSESGQTAAIWGDYDISVGCHNLEVPTIAPELAYGTLRTTLAEEQGGVFLCGVEVGGEYHPCEHILSVGGLHPAFLHLAERELREYMLVLAAYLLHLGLLHVLAGSDDIYVGGSRDALSGGKQTIAVVGELYAAEVSLVVGELAKLALEVHLIEVDTSVPYTDER